MAGVTKQKKATARPKGGAAKSTKNEIPLPAKELRKLLRKMQLLRAFEEATRAKYLEGKVYGFLPPLSGAGGYCGRLHFHP